MAAGAEATDVVSGKIATWPVRAERAGLLWARKRLDATICKDAHMRHVAQGTGHRAAESMAGD